ncbi:hypothetical protein LIER_30413 [Lithospermum erythrorhizon]|uniref:Formin-like protein n=1 Tax=Lithospermum erythrorhizon TaxID=34254 RepID=A0AAV3RR54_LITER
MMLHFVAVFIASLCVSASCRPEGYRKVSDNSIQIFQDVDKHTVEQFLSLCREELTDKVGVADTLKSYLYQTLTNRYFSVYSDSASLGKRFTDKANNDLSSQDIKEFLDCLREENSFATSYSCEGVQSELLNRCPDLFHNWSFVPRRYLRQKRYKKKKHRQKRHANKGSRVRGSQVRSNVPAPSPALKPEDVAQVPAQSPSPISESPSSNQPAAESPELLISPPMKTQNDSPPPESQNGSSTQAENTPSPEKQQSIASKTAENDNKTLIIATTTGSAVAVIALIAFCLIWLIKKGRKDGPKDGHRDDNPLLNLYSSDISAVSSQKSQTGEISSNKDFKTSSIAKKSLAVAGNFGTTAVAASGDATTNLPLPPGKPAPPPPRPPAPPPPKAPANSPPPPPRAIPPPRKPSSLGPNSSRISQGKEKAGDSDGQKAKMKPFFWDKVQANPDHSMVWHDIKCGSFQFNEELMESLFGYAPTNQGNDHKKKTASEGGPNYIQIIDPKKAQNLSILLRALNVTTEEVCDALNEGNELPAELIQTLIKMAPTTDEELKLRLYSGDVAQLGPAERFLIALVEIPFAFKRLESILFMCTLQEELSSVKESFSTLEVACKDLKNSRLFLKLLEAVLKTGNRMNDGTYRGGANAFKLDTLLKLSDVKGTDGQTTLLHFVVQEITRSEGVRAARRLRESQSLSSVKTEDLVDDCTHETEEYHHSLGIQVISGVSDELGSVKKAAIIDGDNLRRTLTKLRNSLITTKTFLHNEMENLEEDSMFLNTLATFVEHTESEVEPLVEEEKRIMDLVKRTGDYFHGNSTKDEGLRLFVIVRDFLIILDKICKEVKAKTKMPTQTPRNEKLTVSSSQESRPESVPDLQKILFPAIQERRASGDDDFSSSDDER